MSCRVQHQIAQLEVELFGEVRDTSANAHLEACWVTELRHMRYFMMCLFLLLVLLLAVAFGVEDNEQRIEDQQHRLEQQR